MNILRWIAGSTFREETGFALVGASQNIDPRCHNLDFQTCTLTHNLMVTVVIINKLTLLNEVWSHVCYLHLFYFIFWKWATKVDNGPPIWELRLFAAAYHYAMRQPGAIFGHLHANPRNSHTTLLNSFHSVPHPSEQLTVEYNGSFLLMSSSFATSDIANGQRNVITTQFHLYLLYLSSCTAVEIRKFSEVWCVWCVAS